MFTLSIRPLQLCRCVRHVAALVLLAWFAVQGASAWAAAPLAGTVISNQASASYKDTAGQVLSSTSNPVSTQITQVGSYTLTPSSNSKTATAGATVYMPYTLTNTGNGNDSFNIFVSEANGAPDFSKIELYPDSGNGLPGNTASLCDPAVTTGCSYTKLLGAGEAFNFLVAYTIPTTAVAASWASNTGTVKVKPTSTGTLLGTYSQSLADKSTTTTDTVKLATGAAFNVTKSLSAPGVRSTETNGAWPVKTSGPAGTDTTFTLSYQNTGASVGNLYLQDDLPSGITFKTGTAVISCAPGIALKEGGTTQDRTTNNGLCSSQGIDFIYTSGTRKIQAIIPNVAPNTSGTLSFQVTIASTAPIGSGSTTNIAKYGDESCTAGATIADCTGDTTFMGKLKETGPAGGTFTVTAARGLYLNVKDATAGTPANSTTDLVQSVAIVPGSFVKQTHTIVNDGNAEDTFNLSVNAGTFPAGTTFTWLKADGSSPLTDSNNDNVVDTGPIAAKTTVTVVLRIAVPLSATLSTGTTSSPALRATALATSIYDAAVKDASYADVVSVVGGYVDLTSVSTGASTTNADAGPGPGTSPVKKLDAVTAGSVVHQLPLFIRNNDSVNNTYDLSASSSSSFPGTLPAGWKVTFSSSACSSVTAISSVAVNAGQQGQAYACVESPVTSPTVDQPVYIKAVGRVDTSVGSTASDIIYYQVAVLAKGEYRMELTANGTGSLKPGGSVDYVHTLTNNGLKTCGSNRLKVTAELPSGYQTTWSTVIYLDGVTTPGVIGVDDTVITDGTLRSGGLAAGGTVTFIVRVFAPAAVNIGTSVPVTVTVSDVDGSNNVLSAPTGCGSLSNTDTTTVVTGALKLDKVQATSTGNCSASFPSTWTADKQLAAPGDCIYYQVTATNASDTPLFNVSVNDGAPAYTQLSTLRVATCGHSGLASGSVSPTTSGSTVKCSSSAANELSPQGTIILRYAVQVDK